MSYENFIGRRYLMTKKRSQVVSIITVISVCGVALGVTALIVVLSVMGGFKKDLKDKILGTKAHAVVMAADGAELLDAARYASQAREVPGVVGAEPYVQADVMVSSPTNLSGVVLRGIDPARIDEVSELRQDITDGAVEFLVDPTPLTQKLDAERDRRIDEIMERVRSGRAEFNALKKDHADEAAGDAPAADTGAQDTSIMPPIFGDESDESDGADGSDGSEEQGADSAQPPGAADSFEMPSIFEDDAAGGQEVGGDFKPVKPAGRADNVPGLLIGAELVKSLQVELGSEINVVTPDGAMGPTGPMPRSRPFRIVGIFKTGMYEYDANYAYANLPDAADFLGRRGATGIEIKTVNSDRAVEIAQDIQQALGDSVEVLDWKEMNRSLFFALELEKLAMFVVLLFIILVASFSIVAMLIMIVIEKARDIAILKAMGVPDASVRRIFTYQGVVIGAVGTLIGLLVGLAICAYLKFYGVPLNSEVYYIAQLPVEIDAVEVVAVILSTLFISWAATIYPAYLASKLKPVDGLRYD